MKTVDILIIGGGSAGMAAACEAYVQGVRDILILERSEYLGGILQQCIHNGFGLHRYHMELTGPEYAKRNIEQVQQMGIQYQLRTHVLNITRDKVVTAVSPTEGLFYVHAKAVVLAMGCRERSRGALMIPGTRPAGVITAGAAQKYLNLNGYLPGKKVVILGSGDIGLIMARQLVMESVEVKEVVELMPFSSGLARNISQCLNDFNIPLSLSSTVTEIKGRRRVSSVVVAKVDASRKPLPGTEREIECDTLMISAGLIPENELTKSAQALMSTSTKGAAVDNNFQTSLPGVFACGNVLHVHDLVDHVSDEGARAGMNAALYVTGCLPPSDFKNSIAVVEGDGVGAVVPQFVNLSRCDATIKFMFRPREKFCDSRACVYADGKRIATAKRMIFSPGEMCEMLVGREKLADCSSIRIQIERATKMEA